MRRRILVLALAAASCLTVAHAQEGASNSAGPIILPAAPPAPILLPSNAASAAPANVTPPPAEIPEVAPAKPVAVAAKPVLPPGPPAPVRSPTAILRVLDKVTAETMRFEAPVGRRVRYKTLIFVVKTCETRGLSDPLPKPSAYVVIDSEPLAPPGEAAPPSREIYRGWMFADSPGLHPFQHPVYDAWLESCTTDTPTS
ncbi:MAG: DUF2155 domain-containing protein [Caulobacteraceae bacterium]